MDSIRDARDRDAREQRGEVVILVADDDAVDLLFTRKALSEMRLAGQMRAVADGAELLAYLRRAGRFEAAADAPRPGLILLDLNMPGVDGRAALREIKRDPALRRIPVVVMTTSDDSAEIDLCYELGANTFITKPASYPALIETVRAIVRYWFDIAALPRG